METPYTLQHSTDRTSAVVASFMTRVYTWMALGLALTGFVAAYLSSHPQTMQTILGSSANVIFLVIAQFGLVFVISGMINRISSATATGLFLVYAALNGVLFSTLFLIYTGQSIAQVFFITAGTFGAMSLYGFVTKTDLTRIGQLAFMALIGLIIASVVNLFVKSSALGYGLSYLGVLIFVGLTAYDTQRLKAMALSVSGNEESTSKGAIVGALALYLDFINLFLMLLRIFGRRR